MKPKSLIKLSMREREKGREQSSWYTKLHATALIVLWLFAKRSLLLVLGTLLFSPEGAEQSPLALVSLCAWCLGPGLFVRYRACFSGAWTFFMCSACQKGWSFPRSQSRRVGLGAREAVFCLTHWCKGCKFWGATGDHTYCPSLEHGAPLGTCVGGRSKRWLP